MCVCVCLCLFISLNQPNFVNKTAWEERTNFVLTHSMEMEYAIVFQLSLLLIFQTIPSTTCQKKLKTKKKNQINIEKLPTSLQNLKKKLI